MFLKHFVYIKIANRDKRIGYFFLTLKTNLMAPPQYKGALGNFV
jgi:hypothetical protein